MNKPDYDLGSWSLGGNLKEFSKKQLSMRMFPACGNKRKVVAKITTWVGTSFNAVHYYVRLEEERNPFWDGKGWRRCWDEKEDEKIETQETKSKKRALEIPKEMF